MNDSLPRLPTAKGLMLRRPPLRAGGPCATAAVFPTPTNPPTRHRKQTLFLVPNSADVERRTGQTSEEEANENRQCTTEKEVQPWRLSRCSKFALTLRSCA